MVALFLVFPGAHLRGQVRSSPGAALTYETVRDAKGPWVIHLVRISRKEPRLQIQSLHAHGKALGLATLTSQLQLLESVPLAAINGDFYERAGPYAGDARGLQIVNGEMISGPAEGASFWLDAAGQPHAGETKGQLEVSWGHTNRTISLNSFRETNAVVLYTPAVGASTGTRGGRELTVAPRGGNEPWLPLRAGRAYHAIVREIRDCGDSPLAAGTMVLSIGPAAGGPPGIQIGSELTISATIEPSLRGVRNAISGGPVLVREGKRVRLQRRSSASHESYESSTMLERHPRSGIGWNDDVFVFVAVDGRNPGVSVGMTLEEFAARFIQLGCVEAFNLDGGGSSTLWYDGKVRNYLCDGYEREIANSLVVAEKRTLADRVTK